jgi:hypothetical protein
MQRRLGTGASHAVPVPVIVTKTASIAIHNLIQENSAGTGSVGTVNGRADVYLI